MQARGLAASGGALLCTLLCACTDAGMGPVDARAPDAPDAALVQRWTAIRQPVQGQPNLFSIWGDAPDSLFLVGSAGTILRAQPDGSGASDRDGKPRLGFTPMQGPARGDLTHVYGTGPKDVYAVGLGGAILHYDGTAWTAETPMKAMPMDPAFTTDLWGVFAYSGGAMAVGKDGTWVKRVMGVWQPPQRLAVAGLFAVYGTAPNDIYAAGSLGYVFRYDGSSWGAMGIASMDAFTNKLAGVFGRKSSDLYVVGLSGALLRRRDQNSFADYGSTISPRCGTGPLPKVFLRNGVVTARGEVVVIGWDGVIARISEGRCADAGMAPQALDETGATDHRLEGLWSYDTGQRTTIYISGVEGVVLRGE